MESEIEVERVKIDESGTDRAMLLDRGSETTTKEKDTTASAAPHTRLGKLVAR